MTKIVFLSPNQPVETTSIIDNYLNLITSQHKVQPKFTSWLYSALSIVSEGINVSNDIQSSFDIDSASGVQLDVIGQGVGRARALTFQPTGGSAPVLDDTNYRIALKAKIAQNQWDGTIPKVYALWDSLFPDIRLSVVDNQDMTMSALLNGNLDNVATQMVTAGYIIPKPAGVSLTIIGVNSIAETDYVGMLVSGMDFITVSTI